MQERRKKHKSRIMISVSLPLYNSSAKLRLMATAAEEEFGMVLERIKQLHADGLQDAALLERAQLEVLRWEQRWEGTGAGDTATREVTAVLVGDLLVELQGKTPAESTEAASWELLMENGQLAIVEPGKPGDPAKVPPRAAAAFLLDLLRGDERAEEAVRTIDRVLRRDQRKVYLFEMVGNGLRWVFTNPFKNGACRVTHVEFEVAVDPRPDCVFTQADSRCTIEFSAAALPKYVTLERT